MIVCHVDRIRDTAADVAGEGWRSLRFGLAGDGLGFTMTETSIAAGTDHVLWYRHHLEGCYCIEGVGEVEDLAEGACHEIRAGTFYALDRHDRHRFRALTDMRLVCVFSPPLEGAETHDADGAYPAPHKRATGERDQAPRSANLSAILRSFGDCRLFREIIRRIALQTVGLRFLPGRPSADPPRERHRQRAAGSTAYTTAVERDP